MSQNNADDIVRVRARLERFQLSHTDLGQQLSDALKRSQRLASSLGFRDIYDAQAAIDTADKDLPPYRQCLEELEMLKAQRDSALARVKELEEEHQFTSSAVSHGHHLSNLDSGSDIPVDVLPFALRLAHCEVSGLRQCDIDELPAEGIITGMHDILDQGLEILRRNARLVREWEDMFSFREKDRKSKVSRLTQAESFRFQRALYRIMLVCWLYGMGSIPESDMQDKGYPYSFYKIYQARQTKFLTKFPTDDLFEIDHVHRFVNWIASFVMARHSFGGTRDTYNWGSLYSFAGPAFIMSQYRDREEDANGDIGYEELCSYLWDDGPYTRFLTCGLDTIFQTRTGGEFDLHNETRILDSVEGADDPCIRCQRRSIFALIYLRNESSWVDRHSFRP